MQALSFYKIFGYPTGLGALVARRDALAALTPRYFGGGTAAACTADADFFRRAARDCLRINGIASVSNQVLAYSVTWTRALAPKLGASTEKVCSNVAEDLKRFVSDP